MNTCRYNIFFLCLLIFSGAVQSAFSQAAEEFNGPFASWANVKSRFGAKGNGKDDDTKALQKAIDELGVADKNGTKYTVLYLPAGTYAISSTLVLSGKIGVSVIGEDPASTIIKWVGPDKDTMFWANGSAFYKIARLSWDAAGHKEMEGIGIHWKNRWNDGKSESHASLNIEIADNNFTGNFKYGISGGTNPGEGTGSNDSEIAIKRCSFVNCSGAGITTTGYNALDYWVWDCRFLNCFDGIDSRYGNFHAYRCYFKNSLQSDVINTNGYYKSMRGCYSEDSRALSLDLGYSINPFKRIYQGNTVMRPKSIPVQYYHWGRLAFFDNFFDKAIDTTVPFFIKSRGSVISFNNFYRSKTAATFIEAADLQNSSDAFTTKQSSTTGAIFTKTQDKTPVYIKRQVFEVPENADAPVIQQIINTAVKLTNKRPIIHFAAGNYKVSKTLLIPAGADIQILGDGFLNASVIWPSADFAASSAVIKIIGPSKVVIRDLQIGNFTNSKSAFDAIQFVNADQRGSRAYIDQLYTGAANSIRGEGLDYLYIQKDNSFFADNDFISGGPMVQNDKGTAGIYGYGGQYAGISLQNNAKAVLKDCWWEGGVRTPLNISGSGRLTIDGAMIAPNNADSTTTVSVKKFKGNISFINMYLEGGMDVAADNQELKLLLMNIHFGFVLDPLKFINKNASYNGVFSGLTSQCFTGNDPKCQQIYKLNEVNNRVPDVTNFIAAMIADDRQSLPEKYIFSNAAASGIFISRTSLGDVNYAIKFTK